MVANFGFLLFSMVNIFKTPGRPCISDFWLAINTHKTLKHFVLGNIEIGILLDFILITIFFAKIGGHHGFEVLFDM